jgi:hypothetical protein
MSLLASRTLRLFHDKYYIYQYLYALRQKYFILSYTLLSYIELSSYHSIRLLYISNALRLRLSPVSPFLAPREMQHRHQKESITPIRNTSQHIPPSNKRSNDAKRTSCKVQSMIGCSDAVYGGCVHVSGG